MVGSNIYFYRLDKIVGRRKYGEAVVDRGVSVRGKNSHRINSLILTKVGMTGQGFYGDPAECFSCINVIQTSSLTSVLSLPT